MDNRHLIPPDRHQPVNSQQPDSDEIDRDPLSPLNTTTGSLPPSLPSPMQIWPTEIQAAGGLSSQESWPPPPLFPEQSSDEMGYSSPYDYDPTPPPTPMAYPHIKKSRQHIWLVIASVSLLFILATLIVLGTTYQPFHTAFIVKSTTTPAPSQNTQSTATTPNGTKAPGVTSAPQATPAPGSTDTPVLPTNTSTPTLLSTVDDTNLTYSGSGWNHKQDTAARWYDTTISESPNSGDTASLSFTGSNVIIHDGVFQNGGIARIVIKDANGITVFSNKLSMYNASTNKTPNTYTTSVLPKQTYQLIITVTGTHETKSSGDHVIIDAIDIFG
jgi:hypothetical protein